MNPSYFLESFVSSLKSLNFLGSPGLAAPLLGQMDLDGARRRTCTGRILWW